MSFSIILMIKKIFSVILRLSNNTKYHSPKAYVSSIRGVLQLNNCKTQGCQLLRKRLKIVNLKKKKLLTEEIKQFNI